MRTAALRAERFEAVGVVRTARLNPHPCGWNWAVQWWALLCSNLTRQVGSRHRPASGLNVHSVHPGLAGERCHAKAVVRSEPSAAWRFLHRRGCQFPASRVSTHVTVKDKVGQAECYKGCADSGVPLRHMRVVTEHDVDPDVDQCLGEVDPRSVNLRGVLSPPVHRHRNHINLGPRSCHKGHRRGIEHRGTPAMPSGMRLTIRKRAKRKNSHLNATDIQSHPRRHPAKPRRPTAVNSGRCNAVPLQNSKCRLHSNRAGVTNVIIRQQRHTDSGFL
mmetsp:Transcript_32060/g.83978  ORF Transcript_32060/g.83978 Transcript_32060/m.83978 type:complete len:275 (-) Transcript_32060:806-1630(-)